MHAYGHFPRRLAMAVCVQKWLDISSSLHDEKDPKIAAKTARKLPFPDTLIPRRR